MTGRMHSTRLKDRLLSHFTHMEVHKQGRDVVLVCNEDIGDALQKTCEHDAEKELLRCGCKKGRRGNCKCVKASLQVYCTSNCGGLVLIIPRVNCSEI